jgi:hypothetical protein
MLQYVALGIFAVRAISLVVNLGFYYDPGLTSNGICPTGFPVNNLIVEKVILVIFNLGNIAIMLYVMKCNEAMESTRQLFMMFIIQDGLSFSISLVLNLFFVIVTAALQGTGVYSMTAALGNGFNMFVLFVQSITTILRNKTTVAQHSDPKYNPGTSIMSRVADEKK